jgi:hypothetical protein
MLSSIRWYLLDIQEKEIAVDKEIDIESGGHEVEEEEVQNPQN